MAATTGLRHNHNNIAIHGRRGARVLVRSTGIKVIARTETTVTVHLDKLTFQRWVNPGRGDIGDGTLPPDNFDIETIAEFENVTIVMNIPAQEVGGITAITLADLIDALESTVGVAIDDVAVVSPIIEPGSVVWVNAHDSADHTHIIGSYLHDLNVNTDPTSATPTYEPFTYDGKYVPAPNFEVEPPILPVKWEGTSPTYFTNNEENAENPNGTPTLFSEYPDYLLDKYQIFDANGNQRLSRLTISLEEIDEYLIPPQNK
jgi:hypothetical protein